MENWQHLPYLLGAYGIAWLGFFGYLLWLARRQRGLARRLETLQADR